jgi:hypothetical protein
MERQVFLDSGLIRPIKYRGLREFALALGTLRGQEVSTTCMAAQHFSGPSNLEALCHRLLCFASRNRFWHKEPAIYNEDPAWQMESVKTGLRLGFCAWARHRIRHRVRRKKS